MPTGLIDPKFCCCAVPLVNAGIHAIIMEQAVLGVAIGVTALTSPNAVGVVVPNFAKVIFAILCLVVTLIQPVGFIGVLREKTTTFKVYAWTNFVAVLSAFICAAALIAVSAVRHEEAIVTCQVGSDWHAINSAQNSTLAEQGEILCSPFAWADIGIMGGLWVLLLLTQLYFIFYTYSYSKSQVKDHKLYHSVYSENPEAFTMSILRSSRYNLGSVYSTTTRAVQDDAWDARPSMDSPGMAGVQPGSYHDRSQSGGYYDPAEEELANYHGHPDQGQYYDQGSYGNGYPPHQQMPQAGPSASAGYGGGYPPQNGTMAFPDPHHNEDPHQQAAPAYGGGGGGAGQAYHESSHDGYDFSRTPPRGGEGDYYPHEPEEARSRDPSATPTMTGYTHGQTPGVYGGDGGLQRPLGVQNHPGKWLCRARESRAEFSFTAEGMFGRKSPRIG
ncbi:hypothetical protein BD324DRAFT_584133 [Kockovaella imperatae]|uniref:MARVEL domain-containing protein n=1 Tax=Kockovaella imperatae TaxID=4999 RepID=A0A1Y1U7L3_9TREE|nr:hypothetical protein BD324DRAFT_584133 [Kockovaella imperatae]ORX33998.1 hypothetical protein BD324DRAFT_584133 [Kockovaella imperatae]